HRPPPAPPRGGGKHDGERREESRAAVHGPHLSVTGWRRPPGPPMPASTRRLALSEPYRGHADGPHAGQVDDERGSDVDLARHADGAAVQLDERLDERQAETAAAAG